MATKIFRKNPMKDLMPRAISAVEGAGGGVVSAWTHGMLVKVNPDTQKPLIDPKYANWAQFGVGVLADVFIDNDHVHDIVMGWQGVVGARLAVQYNLLNTADVGISGGEDMYGDEVGATKKDRMDYDDLLDRAMKGGEEVGYPSEY